MKIISKIITVLLFILFFGFALKNTEQVTLHFFMGYEFPGPLVLMLLIFFVTGVVFGVLAMLPTLFKHQREVSHHKKSLASKEQEFARLRDQTSRPPKSDSV